MKLSTLIEVVLNSNFEYFHRCWMKNVLCLTDCLYDMLLKRHILCVVFINQWNDFVIYLWSEFGWRLPLLKQNSVGDYAQYNRYWESTHLSNTNGLNGLSIGWAIMLTQDDAVRSSVKKWNNQNFITPKSLATGHVSLKCKLNPNIYFRLNIVKL